MLLVKVPEIDVPLPLAAIPVRLTLLSLVHEKFVPGRPFGFVMAIEVIGVPEHIVWEAGKALTVGNGLITKSVAVRQSGTVRQAAQKV